LSRLPKHFELMQTREKEVASILRLIEQRSNNFEEPKLILIGGYAMRAFTPYSRATRDCDFAVPKAQGWSIDTINGWMTNGIYVETVEKKETHGFLRWSKNVPFGRREAKVSVDFLEGEVRGRAEKAVVLIDRAFSDGSERKDISVADQTFRFHVPRYVDYLIMKIVSGRPSDIRDVATLLWKNGLPSGMKSRLGKILPYPEIFTGNIREKLIPVVSDKRFLYSWKGTFATKDFDEEAQAKVLRLAESFI